jgi:RPA family protein
VKGTAEGIAPVVVVDCTGVKMERVTCNGTAVEKPVVSTQKKKKDGSTK